LRLVFSKGPNRVGISLSSLRTETGPVSEIFCFLVFRIHRLRVFDNRVLRRIFGPKRDEVTGEWKKLHNEELRDL
jgi:hypothetical protein